MREEWTGDAVMPKLSSILPVLLIWGAVPAPLYLWLVVALLMP